MEVSPLLRREPATKQQQSSPVRIKKANKSVEDDVTNPKLLALVVSSIVLGAANSVTYKKLLNRFSSPTHNYEFFVSQWSTLLYMLPSILIVLYRQYYHVGTRVKQKQRDDRSLQDGMQTKEKQCVFFNMGFLDSASATLGALGGSKCPGQLQTMINQTIIPETMAISYFKISKKIKVHQVTGAGLILLGSIVASLPFFLSYDSHEDVPGAAPTSSIMIFVFFISVIPGAISNVYKEEKMKGKELDVYEATTAISIWQFLLGFLFMPLLMLKAFGGLSGSEISSQMADGFICFLGENPRPTDNCEGAFWLFNFYVLINLAYNILLMRMTKEGSAILLTISGAIGMPITNLAFSIKAIMGDEVEPFTIYDFGGLILVCVGFLTYSAFGFAKKIMPAISLQAGQVAYTEPMQAGGHEGGIILTAVNAMNPAKLAQFLILLHGGLAVMGKTAVSDAKRYLKRVMLELEKVESISPSKSNDLLSADKVARVSSPSSFQYTPYGSRDVSFEQIGEMTL